MHLIGREEGLMARRWKNGGFTFVEAKMWKDIGFGYEEAIKWCSLDAQKWGVRAKFEFVIENIMLYNLNDIILCQKLKSFTIISCNWNLGKNEIIIF